MEATFCFVDLAGYTALTEAHGAQAAADCVQRFVTTAQAALGDEGRLIERVGDAIFVTTAAPAAGVRFLTRLFAMAAQHEDFLVLRAGLHHGEALEHDGHFFGPTINLAARVAAQASGGQVLGTSPVADVARAQNIEVVRLGQFTLRNVRNPVELFDIKISTLADASAVDPVCRMRVSVDRAAGRLRFDDIDYWFCSLECAATFAADPGGYARP